ncbi:hypothetical protein DFH05DRAFT_280339 [Lentinula detonsa]|uniref:Uncharacterized protein n=1 Tax=Lentinula detonsa TaxID=2804962 RepID=A0A9W8NWB7_9AGAR|nr:hypothetical protein DFH05DRAFT_280339 [Lentinula detonsa]
MAIHIKNLKVRPRKNDINVMCAPQLTTLLGCWAASSDLHSTTPMPKKMHRPTINYHLARLSLLPYEHVDPVLTSFKLQTPRLALTIQIKRSFERHDIGIY